MMELLTQILEFVKSFGSMAHPERVAATLTLLLSLWKSSLLRPFWDKLGAAQAAVGPLLAVALALTQMPALSLSNLWAALAAGGTAGGLSIALHELLTMLQSAAWVGEPLKKWVALVDTFLRRPAVKAEEKKA